VYGDRRDVLLPEIRSATFHVRKALIALHILLQTKPHLKDFLVIDSSFREEFDKMLQIAEEFVKLYTELKGVVKDEK